MGEDPAGDPATDRDRHSGDVDGITAVGAHPQLARFLCRQQDRHHVVAHHIADDGDDPLEQGAEVEDRGCLLRDPVDDAQLARVGHPQDVLGAGGRGGRGRCHHRLQHLHVPGRLSQGPLAAHDHEGVGERRVEVDARKVGELRQPFRHRGLGLEWEVERDGEEGVDDRDDPGFEGDRLAS